MNSTTAVGAIVHDNDGGEIKSGGEGSEEQDGKKKTVD